MTNTQRPPPTVNIVPLIGAELEQDNNVLMEENGGFNTGNSLLNITNSTNYTNDTQQQINSFHFYQNEQLVFLVILLAFIVIGNAIVLVAVALARRHSRMNYFIVHLAIADLASGLVSVTTDLIWKITIGWYAGPVMCKIVRFLQVVVTYASTYMLVALSIDRLDAIARPLGFSSSGTRSRILVALAWAFSLLFGIPMLVMAEQVEKNDMPMCWMNLSAEGWQIYMVLVALSIFIIPALIIAICYITIIAIIWRSNNMQAAVTSKSDNHRRSFSSNGISKEVRKQKEKESGRSSKGIIPQAKIRTIKMTFTIVLVFIFCWSPYFVYDLLQVFGHIPQTQTMVAVTTFVQSVAPLNSAANPIIYGIFSTRICRQLRRIRVVRYISDKISCCREEPSMRSTNYNTNNSEYTNVSETDIHRRSVYAMERYHAKSEMCDVVLSAQKHTKEDST
ncbi:hypothetical protein ScPMuIL_016804 [Solemya velum]